SKIPSPMARTNNNSLVDGLLFEQSRSGIGDGASLPRRQTGSAHQAFFGSFFLPEKKEQEKRNCHETYSTIAR
ncbi:MAG: hypothetical protein JXC36_08625, partial [Candidatus Atribacteria bacterium]|nr:hypothetical protein [Candidatus Atribacteria bacterium]